MIAFSPPLSKIRSSDGLPALNCARAISIRFIFLGACLLMKASVPK